jgi:hypothetical protein
MKILQLFLCAVFSTNAMLLDSIAMEVGANYEAFRPASISIGSWTTDND